MKWGNPGTSNRYQLQSRVFLAFASGRKQSILVHGIHYVCDMKNRYYVPPVAAVGALLIRVQNPLCAEL